MHLNVQSLYNKLDEIKLKIHENDPDVFAITETWLKNIDDKEIDIDNYNLFRCDRAGGWGGVALYIHNRLNANVIRTTTADKNTKVESLWVKISLPKTRPILLGVIYAADICNKFFEDLQSELDEINNISVSSRTPGEITCLGHFNCDGLHQTSWEWRKLSSVMSIFHMSQMITKPTRITQTTKTLIDHVWTTSPEHYSNNGVLTVPISDHSLTYAIRKAAKKLRGKPRIINARSYKRFVKDNFLNDLEQVPWSSIEVSNDPDLAWNIFVNLLTPIFDTHAPFKQTKIPSNPPRWINDEYLSCRTDMIRARSHAQRSGSEADWIDFKLSRNKLLSLLLKQSWYQA